MIESTIRERENEITVNQLRMAAAAGGGSGLADGGGAPSGGFALDGVDYGLSGGPAGGKAAAAQFAEGIATAAAGVAKWEAAGGGGGGEGALSRMRVGRG